MQKANTKEAVLTKEIPELPWQIVASDLFEFKGDSYLVIYDSYSGFLDLQKLKNQTSCQVITHFKQWFATHWIPQRLESDNDTQCISKEFKEFQKM